MSTAPYCSQQMPEHKHVLCNLPAGHDGPHRAIASAWKEDGGLIRGTNYRWDKNGASYWEPFTFRKGDA